MSAVAIRQAALRVMTGLAVIAGAASPTASQAAAQNSDPGVWVGTWTGPFVTEGPTGTFTLVIARNGDAWKVENSVESDGAPPPGEVREFKVEGNAFSFVQSYADLEVIFRGALEGGELKGTLEAYQGGGLVGTGTFTLIRQ